MRIDYYKDIVCIQIVRSERWELIRKLRALEQQTNAAQEIGALKHDAILGSPEDS